jgi:ADP-ribose pyrophosphatase
VTTHSEVVFRGKRFNIERISATDSRGRQHTREVLRHPGAVVLLPLLDGDRVVMINNFRVSVGRTLLELPAGTVEPNEPHDKTAARELIEETGYRAERIEPFHKFYASPGVMDEQMILYVATGLVEGAPEREAGEEIENRIMTWPEINEAIRKGDIVDGKSLVGLLLYQQIKGIK